MVLTAMTDTEPVMSEPVPCYHKVMQAVLSERQGYLFPEEACWLMAHPHGVDLPPCEEQPCIHWPIFTVCQGSPYSPYYGKPECYKGFRSDPRPLMGVLRLNTAEEDAEILAYQNYLRSRLGFSKGTSTIAVLETNR